MTIKRKSNKITNNIYMISFYIFMFGFLIVFDYFSIKNWPIGENTMFFVPLIFWGIGIFYVIKCKKNNYLIVNF